MKPEDKDGSASDRLWVYGTLMSGSSHPMALWLRSQAALLGEGTAPGRLVLLHEGDLIYPGWVEGPGLVVGEVWRLSCPQEVWPVLDAYEGCGPSDPPPHEYRREGIPVRMGAALLSCWAYRYQGAVAGLEVLAEGRFQPS